MDIILPPYEDLDENGNYIGNDPKILAQENPGVIDVSKGIEILKKLMHER